MCCIWFICYIGVYNFLLSAGCSSANTLQKKQLTLVFFSNTTPKTHIVHSRGIATYFIFLATFSFLCDPGPCHFRVAFKNGKGSFFSMIMHSNIKTKRWIWNFNQNGHSRLCRWCLYGKKGKSNSLCYFNWRMSSLNFQIYHTHTHTHTALSHRGKG